jgi:hypothetical protein
VVAEGVGKVAATIRSFFSPGPEAPAGKVKDGALSDLNALLDAHMDQAAAEAAAIWSGRPRGSEAIAEHPELWGAASESPVRINTALDMWAAHISTEIAELGERRRGVAKVASLGVNVLGTGVILAVFANTGGLTGAEAGIAAATAVINQTLLEAIFGEANVSAFVDRARRRLDEIITGLFAEDEARFEAALGLSPDSRQLAQRLRSAAEQLDP